MTSENLYEAPDANLAQPAMWVPEEILKKIKHGWIAALFSAAMTLGATLLAMSGTEVLGFSAWELFDVALILILAFGIYKKSRTCAVLMLVYFISAKIILMMETGKPSGLVVGLLFAIFYWQAVVGTFAFHKLKKEHGAPRS